MTASLPSAPGLFEAISELEQALSALAQTVNSVSETLAVSAVPGEQRSSVATGDMIATSKVREELVALQEMVSGAAELIALARLDHSADGTHQQETH